MKQREPRQRVILPVRLRLDNQWIDAQIRNVSSKGVMLVMKDPPPKGSFIEIRRGTTITIIGQVRWCASDRCGILAQDKINVSYLMSDKAQKDLSKDQAAFAERRATVRIITPEEAAEHSRLKSQLLQRVFIIVAGVAGALFLASLLFDVLNVPLEAIKKNL